MKKCPVCYGRGYLTNQLKNSVKFKGKNLKLLETVLTNAADSEVLPEKDIATLIAHIYRSEK